MTILQALACLVLGAAFFDELRAALRGRRGVRSVVYLAVACVACAFMCSGEGNPVDALVLFAALGLWVADVLAGLLRDLL